MYSIQYFKRFLLGNSRVIFSKIGKRHQKNVSRLPFSTQILIHDCLYFLAAKKTNADLIVTIRSQYQTVSPLQSTTIAITITKEQAN
jgi:hypothetical protein